MRTERVKRVITPDQALSLLMDKCAKSERTKWDCRQALYRWGIETSIHETIIETLVQQKFIDEKRYAAAYVREKANLSRWGSYKIRTGLRTKQISEDIINEALKQIDSESMGIKLEEQLIRKMRTIKSKSSFDLKGKLLRYGTGLGFGFEQVNEIIEKLVKDNDSI